MVTPVACFAAGHQTIFKQELAALDVGRRRQLFRVVGPPHEILQCWNVRVSVFVRPRAVDKIIADERTAVSRVWIFFFPRTFFLALGLVGAVLLGSFQACAIYIPAAPDVQGNRAKSKPLLLRGGLGRGWRRGGGWLQQTTGGSRHS